MQVLDLPLTVHLIRNSLNGARATLSEARSILGKVTEIWRQAGIEIKVRAYYELQVDLEALEAAYPNPAKAGKTERVSSCDRLRLASRYDEQALNLYLVQRVRSYGTADLINVTETFRTARSLLVAEHYPPLSTQLSVAAAIGRFLGLKLNKTAPVGALMNHDSNGTDLGPGEIDRARQSLLKEFPPRVAASVEGEVSLLPVRAYLVHCPAHATRRAAAHIEELVARANELWREMKFLIDLKDIAPHTCTDAQVLAAVSGAANCLPLLTGCPEYRDAMHLFFAADLPGGFTSHVFPRMQVAVIDDREEAFGLGQVLSLLGLLYPQVEYETLAGNGIPGMAIHQLLKHTRQLYSAPGEGEQLPTRTAPRGDTWEKVMADLDALIGLDEVKAGVRRLADFLRLEQRRRSRRKATESVTLHTLLTGNPGTGKTTLARLLGRLFKAAGFLPGGQVVEADRSLLVTDSARRTAERVKEAVRQARGGVLFIDNAHTLILNSNDPQGVMAVHTLVQQMEDQNDQFALVLAGWADPVQSLLRQNRGLQSRLRNQFELPDCGPPELSKIFVQMASQRGFQLTRNAFARLHELTERLYRNREVRFGNARLVRNLLELAIERQSSRLAPQGSVSDSQLFLLQSKDIAALPEVARAQDGVAVRITDPPLSDSLERVFQELDALVGLAAVKKQVRALADRFRVEQRRARKNPVTLHMIFAGPPGTGKTTVARLLGRIFFHLDLLQRGHVLETDRAGLVAEYLGQTAIKTHRVIDRALGGVLFIDEAYALCDGSPWRNYGQEALVTLLKRMEDQSDRLCVVLAGYPEEMDLLLESNPGLPSRFPHRIEFPNYKADELLQILQLMASERDLKLEEAALPAVQAWLKRAVHDRGDHFGNGRVARNLLERMLEKQAERLGQQDFNDELDLLRAADVPDYTPIGGRPRIGFRK